MEDIIKINSIKIPTFNKYNKIKNTSILINKENNLKKIAICIPFFNRFRITDFVFKHYFKLKKELENKVELILIAVGSEGIISRALAEKNGFHYYEYPNKYVSRKYNETFRKAKNFGVDAVIKVDSDSIISKNIILYYLNCINRNIDYTGITDIYFAFNDYYCYWEGYVGKRKGETTGVGRYMSKRLLDLLDWNVINKDTNLVCDYIMTQNINRFNLKIKKEAKKCKNLNGYIIDLKSNFQITSLYNAIYSSISPINKCHIDLTEIKIFLKKMPKSSKLLKRKKNIKIK